MDNVFEKINSIIETDKINSKDEFIDFIECLTNHPDPLREACAYKLEELFDEKYVDEYSLNKILNAITDINPNVSRAMCRLISEKSYLQDKLSKDIIQKIKNILNEIPKNETKTNNKSHAKNKLFFSLYWLLEALSYCKINDEVNEILQYTIKFSDYTIREKTAKILSKMVHPDKELLDEIKRDTNFYVNFYTNLYKN